MSKICYVPHKFSPGTMKTLSLANSIIAEYAKQGFDLTLRQLYYQLVSRDVIPNKQSEYKRLGQIISDARRAGLIDWLAIVDRTRNIHRNSHWDSPADILKSAEDSFQVDKWQGQKYCPEVWVEKDALIGVLESACQPLDVAFFACRGYNSDSEMWRAAMRFVQRHDNDQIPVIIHLGDHDPSGIDMTRDIEDRIKLFCGKAVAIERIALNYGQIELYGPPPNPAKETDSRWAGYVETYGVIDSWELDALEPQVIVDLIEAKVLSLRDQTLWNARVEEENKGKEALAIMRMDYEASEEDEENEEE